MKTQFLLAASLVSACLIVSGDMPRHALAQQDIPSPRPAHFEWTAQRMEYHLLNGLPITTLQGGVEMKSLDGTPITITREGGFLVFKTPSETPQAVRVPMDAATMKVDVTTTEAVQIIKVPMDAATMKVSVTTIGTVFEDAKNDKLTVTLHTMP